MAHNYRGGFLNITDRRSLAEAYGYPDGTTGFVMTFPGAGSAIGEGKTQECEVHYLWGSGTPNNTTHGNAPNSSEFVDHATGKRYVKLGAPGSGIAGTWTKEPNA